MDVFIEGVHKLQDKQLRLICLKALCKVAPSYLNQFDINALLLENSKIRKVVCRYLPNVVTIEKLKSMKDIFCEVQPSGLLQYLRMVDQKSYWVFLDEGLQILISETDPQLLSIILNALYFHTYIYGRLSEELYSGIKEKLLILLKHEDRALTKFVKDMVRQLDFYMRTDL